MTATASDTEEVGLATRFRQLPESARALLVALPSYAYIGLFFVAPLLYVLNYSVRTQENFQVTNVFTLDNFAYVFTTDTFTSSLLYSVKISLAATAITLAVGLPVAYYVAIRASDRSRNVLLFMIIAPLWVNFFVRAYAIVQIAGTRGIVNVALTKLGLISEPITWLLYSEPAVIIGLSYVWFPLMVLPIYAVLQHLEHEWLEAARDMGAGPLRAHWEVTIPTAMPGIVLGSLFVFLLSLGNQTVPKVLGGAKKTPYSEAILLQLEGAVNWPVAAAASAVMMAFILLLLAGIFTVLDVEELF